MLLDNELEIYAALDVASVTPADEAAKVTEIYFTPGHVVKEIPELDLKTYLENKLITTYIGRKGWTDLLEWKSSRFSFRTMDRAAP